MGKNDEEEEHPLLKKKWEQAPMEEETPEEKARQAKAFGDLKEFVKKLRSDLSEDEEDK